MGHAHSFGCALACFHSCLPSFMPVRHSHLFIVCACLQFVSVRCSHPFLPTGCMHSWSSNPWAVCICLGVLLYGPMPTFVLAHCRSHPFLPTAHAHSQLSMLMLSALVCVCTHLLLLAVILCITYHT